MGDQLPAWVWEGARLFVGPLAGALAGALTAQAIAKRNAKIQRQLDELRATNAAVSATRAIVASIAALKQQHVRPMKETYEEQVEARDAAQSSGHPFHFSADLETLPPVRTALPMLEKLLYERVSAPAGALGLFAVVSQAIGGINDAIESRNAIINSLRSQTPLPASEFAEIYFGLVNEAGHADLRFPQLIQGLAHNVDCAILYGCVLARELSKHAHSISRKSKELPAGEKAEFMELARAGLIPELSADDRRAFEALKVVPELPATG
jgi:hypothetical protein